MKMFKVVLWRDKIEECEVLRETALYVFISDAWRKDNEIKELKRGTWFATWGEAHAFLLKDAEIAAAFAEAKAVATRRKLADIQSMTAEAGK